MTTCSKRAPLWSAGRGEHHRCGGQGLQLHSPHPRSRVPTLLRAALSKQPCASRSPSEQLSTHLSVKKVARDRSWFSREISSSLLPSESTFQPGTGTNMDLWRGVG